MSLWQFRFSNFPICIYPRPAPVRCYLTGGQAAMKFHVTLSVLFALKCPFCLQIAFKKWKWDVPVFSLQNICGTRDYPGSAPGHSSMSISDTNAAKLELARTSLLYLWEASKGKTLKLYDFQVTRCPCLKQISVTPPPPPGPPPALLAWLTLASPSFSRLRLEEVHTYLKTSMKSRFVKRKQTYRKAYFCRRAH